MRVALKHGNLKVARYLMEIGVDRAEKVGAVGVALLARHGHVEPLKQLLTWPPAWRVQDIVNGVANATMHLQPKAIAILLNDAYVNLLPPPPLEEYDTANKLSALLHTALGKVDAMAARKKQMVDVVAQELVQHGVSWKLGRKGGELIEIAAKHNLHHLLRAALKRGIAPSKQSLRLAIAARSKECVQLLLSTSLAFDATTSSKTLIDAIATNDTEIVTLLLDAGADPTTISSPPNTSALIVAARFNNAELIKILLRRGAPLDVVNASHETAFDIGTRHGASEEVLRLLSVGEEE